MKTASITEARNQLSALIDLVRAGESVVITDRGRPVARLVPETADATGDDGEARLARLERAGVIRRAKQPLDGPLGELPPPVPLPGVLDALLDERREGR